LQDFVNAHARAYHEKIDYSTVYIYKKLVVLYEYKLFAIKNCKLLNTGSTKFKKKTKSQPARCLVDNKKVVLCYVNYIVN
jgi:hypothetical protein